MINAGKYKHRIKIYERTVTRDSQGFNVISKTLKLNPYADVKTTRGMTLIKNDSDFEKAYTRFTVRFPNTEIRRDFIIEFGNKEYSIEYMNNVNEESIELELQCKEIEK